MVYTVQIWSAWDTSEWMHARYEYIYTANMQLKVGYNHQGGFVDLFGRWGIFTMQHAAKNGILVSGWGDL